MGICHFYSTPSPAIPTIERGCFPSFTSFLSWGQGIYFVLFSPTPCVQPDFQYIQANCFYCLPTNHSTSDNLILGQLHVFIKVFMKASETMENRNAEHKYQSQWFHSVDSLLGGWHLSHTHFCWGKVIPSPCCLSPSRSFINWNQPMRHKNNGKTGSFWPPLNVRYIIGWIEIIY